MGARRHRRCVLLRFCGFGCRQSADRAHDGPLRAARGDGARRRADGRRAVARAADDAALASLSHDRRDGRRGQRVPRLFRPVAVSAELVHSPPRARHGARLCRRRHRLGHLAAMGAAHDRADRLAHRLHRDGYSGASPYWRRSIFCCGSGPRISGCCRMAMRRRRRHRPHLVRMSSIPSGPIPTGHCVAHCAPRDSGG